MPRTGIDPGGGTSIWSIGPKGGRQLSEKPMQHNTLEHRPGYDIQDDALEPGGRAFGAVGMRWFGYETTGPTGAGGRYRIMGPAWASSAA